MAVGEIIHKKTLRKHWTLIGQTTNKTYSYYKKNTDVDINPKLSNRVAVRPLNDYYFVIIHLNRVL